MKQKLVVLTGAGISAESGIKTFRDSDGLWEGYDVTEVASPEGWKRDPKLVLDFYNMRRRQVLEASPNQAHSGLAALEKYFDVQIITQNIDDLHERGGSTNVIHLHGEIFRMRSEKALTPSYEIRTDMQWGDLAADGGQLRPDIVWFGEAVPMIEKAAQIAMEADIFVVVGTSMVVYPAAGLIDMAPLYSPKFVIDKKIPYVNPMHHLTTIEKPATEGVQELTVHLMAMINP
ncbi:MAG TPA: Sir2 family NAD-dependent protein deacetylase [Niabella sp.]|nr:Sir2 family NAD-dependent protein deacetylase [Niabella sp.]HOZ98111.1 Sir2 family NAD-dependent protein deacetylase [Niabella sp.]HQW16145.1 Sir2 family NAD-dependent protein deacetylase [Niabella sp.]HQX21357.1 Sir2 family NAD-dependent protein deacetylase [Niabella sp.]HQX42233.1 Sir2 family NAD-dependent protein deacetylase [Niabella sp.]